MDLPPVQQQQSQPSRTPTASRSSASKTTRATKSDAAPSTVKTRTSVATQVLKTKSDVPTNSDTVPTINSDTASPQSRKVRFKARANKPKKAKVPITEITDFTLEEEQAPSTTTPDLSQALMGAIIHDTAPENYKSDAVIEDSDKVVLEALQSLAKADEEPSKSKSADKENVVPDSVKDAVDPASDDAEDDDNEDDENEDETSKSVDGLRTEVANFKETQNMDKKRHLLPLKEDMKKLINERVNVVSL
ncbi:uncharacterized protein LOC135147882 [Daucus carota subsp. sativus]|uniref:uncharacterized protein LOC135147882 n=1 Tax=Daucus carota subsp. sativus TaxID=79200 RepID=UPI0030829C7D